MKRRHSHASVSCSNHLSMCVCLLVRWTAAGFLQRTKQKVSVAETVKEVKLPHSFIRADALLTWLETWSHMFHKSEPLYLQIYQARRKQNRRINRHRWHFVDIQSLPFTPKLFSLEELFCFACSFSTSLFLHAVCCQDPLWALLFDMFHVVPFCLWSCRNYWIAVN